VPAERVIVIWFAVVVVSTAKLPSIVDDVATVVPPESKVNEPAVVVLPEKRTRKKRPATKREPQQATAPLQQPRAKVYREEDVIRLKPFPKAGSP